MAYRDDEQALRQRIAALAAELERQRTRNRELERETVRDERLARRAEARLREAGPGAGWRGPRRDRIDLAALVLVLVCVPLLPLHIRWHHHIATDASVIPAIVWLGTPGLLAALVAWPYRGRGPRFVALLALGILFALAPLLNLGLAPW